MITYNGHELSEIYKKLFTAYQEQKQESDACFKEKRYREAMEAYYTKRGIERAIRIVFGNDWMKYLFELPELREQLKGE